MKKLASEFKTFIMRGNIIDLAVGVIIGTSFTAIVNSVVHDLFMPFISLITGGISFDAWEIVIGLGDTPATLKIGSFLAAVVNFLLIALVLFLVVKGIQKVREMHPKEADEAEAAKKIICPFCKSDIPADATRCPSCTSFLNDGFNNGKDNDNSEA